MAYARCPVLMQSGAEGESLNGNVDRRSEPWKERVVVFA